MKDSIFWKGYFLVTGLTIALLVVLEMLFPGIRAVNLFSFITIACFSAVLILFYRLGREAVRSSDPYKFVRLMLMLFLLKFFLCVVLVAVYWKIEMPEDKAAIVPFFTIYIIYTIFEVYFFTRIAQISPGQAVKQEPDDESSR